MRYAERWSRILFLSSLFIPSFVSRHADFAPCYSLWNYNPLNTNAEGDSWEREDFSIFSLDAPPPALPVSTSPHDAALNVGARALNAFEVRPLASSRR